MSAHVSAVAGTLESNDILVTISSTGGSANSVSLSSIVISQFGPAIRAVIDQCLEASGLSGVEVTVQDKGALECTIKARMETAIARYKEKM
ncbi:MAG: citrate lyase acyl carrier protein [Desulfovibrio sp.]|uniref:citrate lyase acyl carrier protein n=1 Tax=Desulfovibrio sp. TaxID=885 RepID=UPI00135D804E|nr:citrate lyase acyl carrier protein [Desulfovibrio sp.]MTJ92222.1 citrate lyase acyl carrier protein [Desulfovibrio sp.]